MRVRRRLLQLWFFFFNDTATTEIYTLSLHDALPISGHLLRRHPAGADQRPDRRQRQRPLPGRRRLPDRHAPGAGRRSEEHTSELQSRQYLVCRLLLEKKKKYESRQTTHHVLPSLVRH